MKHNQTSSESNARAVAAENAHDSLRVLIADDYADAAESLSQLLVSARFEVRTAIDGTDAIEHACAWKPDVFILDLDMPKLDGCEVAMWVSAQRWARRPLLIALSGWARAEDQARVRAAGFDHYFLKPAEPEGIFAVIEAYQGQETSHPR